MPYLSPPTLTKAEQQSLLVVSAVQPRDHLVFSLALGTGLRLSETVGLSVGDVFTADGRPRTRLRLRKEIAKGGRAGDVFRAGTTQASTGEGGVGELPNLHTHAGQPLWQSATQFVS
jgi:integrase